MDPVIFNYLLEEYVQSFPQIEYRRIEEFLLNIVLILAGVRWGFLDELSNHYPREFKLIMDNLNLVFPEQLVFRKHHFSNGYLIYLTDNAQLISDIENSNDVHTGLGYILGFSCVGSDWSNRSIDRYVVNIVAKHRNHEPNYLITYMCPVTTFSDTDKIQSFDLVARSNHVLGFYDYEVTLKIELIPTNSTKRYPTNI